MNMDTGIKEKQETDNLCRFVDESHKKIPEQPPNEHQKGLDEGEDQGNLKDFPPSHRLERNA